MGLKQASRIGVVLILAGWCSGAAGSDSRVFEVRGEQEWMLAREEAASLSVRTIAGNVRVVGAAGDRLQIHAVKKVRADVEAEARAFLDEIKVDRRREDDRWVIEATWPNRRPREVRSAEVSFEIDLPRSMRLETQITSGSVEATGIAEARLRTSSGDLVVRDLGGALDAHTSSGSVRAIRVAGPLQAHVNNGGVRIEECAGPVEAHVSSGRIELREAPGRVRATVSSGDIEVELGASAEAPEVELQTNSGRIQLSLPPTLSARVDAGTTFGRVQVEPDDGVRFNPRHTHMDAVLGDGRGSVHLGTSVGDIHIRLSPVIVVNRPRRPGHLFLRSVSKSKREGLVVSSASTGPSVR